MSKSKINKDILLSTTLAQVFFSTIVFGGLIPYIIKFWKSFEKIEEIDHNKSINEDKNSNNLSIIGTGKQFYYEHPNFVNIIEDYSKEKNIKILKRRLSYYIGKYWLEFDNDYIKPKLICNWPEIKKEQNEITEVIINEVKKFINEKNEKFILLDDKNENKNNDDNYIENKLEEKLIVSS